MGSSNVKDEDNNNVNGRRHSKARESIRRSVIVPIGNRFPRIFAILVGMVIPVCGLILMSYFLGFALAELESPAEFDRNDAIVSDLFYIQQYQTMILDIVGKVPVICYNIHLHDNLLIKQSNNSTRTGNSTTETYTSAVEKLSVEIAYILDILPLTTIQHKTGNKFSRDDEKFNQSALIVEIDTISGAVNAIETDFHQSNIEKKTIEEESSDTGAFQALQTDSSSGIPKEFGSTSFIDASQSSSSSSRNSKLYNQMAQCSEIFQPLIGALLKRSEYHAKSVGQLTFNWNRCINKTFVEDNKGTASIVDLSRPLEQAKFYTTSWVQQQKSIYNHLLVKNDDHHSTTGVSEITNATSHNATLPTKMISKSPKLLSIDMALIHSVKAATGSTGCVPNAAATAFFWFTVMTSVGYGNQAPESDGGHIMVYTLGFLSLLCFAGVLRTSGNVMVVLFEDYSSLIQSKLHFPDTLRRPFWSCLWWGTWWYLYMLIIALFVQNWWKYYMGLDVSFGDSYWFSYISTTTIGFGDYYPQPEGMFIKDVFFYSILFLIGFTSASGFLGIFGDLTAEFFPDVAKGLKKRIIRQRIGEMTQQKSNDEQQIPPVIGRSHDEDDEEERQQKEALKRLVHDIQDKETLEQLAQSIQEKLANDEI